MDEPDFVPLAKRMRLPLRRRQPEKVAASAVDPSRTSSLCPAGLPDKKAFDRAPEERLGWPRGVKFFPSDEDLLWHLLAKVGKGGEAPHPLINNFIISLDNYEIRHVHPLNLPGSNQDGRAAYFFHRKFALCDGACEKSGDMFWNKIGESKPIYIDGTYWGYKMMLVLYARMMNGDKLDKSNWLMHQYYLRSEGHEYDLVVSKLFYQQNPKSSNSDVKNTTLENSGSVLTEIESGLLLEKENMELATAEAPDQGSGHSTVKQLAINEICTNDAEKDSAESLSTSNSFSPDSVVVDARDEGVPICDQMGIDSSYEKHSDKDSLPNDCSKPNRSPTSMFLIPFKKQHSQDDCVNSKQACDTLSLRNPSVGFLEKVVAHNSSVCLPNSLGERCSSEAPFIASQKSPENQEDGTNLCCIKKTCDSLPSIPRRMQNQKNVKQHLELASTCFPVSVKNEPIEENCINDGYLDGSGNDVSSQCTDYPLLTSSSVKENCFGHNFSNSGNFQYEISPSCCNAVEEGDSASRSLTSMDVCTLKNPASSNIMVELKPEYPDCVTDIHCSNLSSSSLEMSKLMSKEKFVMGDTHAEDFIDHLPLKERMKFLRSDIFSDADHVHGVKSSHRKTLLALDHSSVSPSNPKSGRTLIRKKRKKTATNSVETALEEDAPGLLQMLFDMGIEMQEIKLYGDEDDDEAIDIPEENSFVDLEEVMNKLFGDHPSFIKFPAIRETRGLKTVYCLSCLISLIEQTRYLRFRNIPVTWGWCRDLQSFIFVFESHNRIILERPEYGYATYFFELVGILPIDWQVKRLIIAMKVATCCRSSIMENKPLLIGRDLSEGEAQVLQSYGWTPNTGLASMLNFHDRVFHDQRRESNGDEWRSRIRKHLMSGHDGGRSFPSSIPIKAMQRMGGNIPDVDALLKNEDPLPEIKMEY